MRPGYRRRLVVLVPYRIWMRSSLYRHVVGAYIADAFALTFADLLRLYAVPVAIDDIMQGVCIQVDERGARAVVYTGICVPGAVPQWGRMITFNVDRPFMYALMTRDRLPLFIGAVRNL